LCIFVLDLDPPNFEFSCSKKKLRIRLPIEGFRLDPRVLVVLGFDSIPGDLVRLRTLVLGHSIP
jgi:hypothetical protein